ncbi:glycosyltransferase family 2 protein [Agaribacterium haliotis]|uniref:glycosyltransferase family 2 protein n=1 Tax=Agaribacterium haliotis TaxID=2013869 RepID=UPI000BB54A5A|nr:glycosyltransferase family 2 protein [Agaribacterium haliotis]
MQAKRILIIIPAYNEAASIVGVVNSINEQKKGYFCVVINDGSQDDTAQLAENAGAKVLDLPANLGIGGAVQTGFKYAKRFNFDVAIQFDGDGQHMASEIPKLIHKLDDGYDICIGSRFVEQTQGFQSTRIRRLGIYFFETLNRLLIKQRVTDSTSGFRAYGRPAIEFLADNYPTDYPEPEAVIELARAGFKLTEVATEMKARQGGESSISSWKSIYYMVKVSISMLMAYWRSRKNDESK